MKLFVVTEGSYSDYHIEAIFESKDEAVSFIGESIDCEISEWETGCPEESFVKTWQVSMAMHDGRLLGVTTTIQRHVRGWSQAYERPISYWGMYPETAILSAFARSTVSQEHAVKLCAEARQAILRNQGAKTV